MICQSLSMNPAAPETEGTTFEEEHVVALTATWMFLLQHGCSLLQAVAVMHLIEATSEQAAAI